MRPLRCPKCGATAVENPEAFTKSQHQLGGSRKCRACHSEYDKVRGRGHLSTLPLSCAICNRDDPALFAPSTARRGGKQRCRDCKRNYEQTRMLDPEYRRNRLAYIRRKVAEGRHNNGSAA